VLTDADPGAAGPQGLGRELARLIFVHAGGEAGLPAPLAAVIDGPGSEDAERALEEAIATGHPDWAPRAMMMLGNMLEYQFRDYDGARGPVPDSDRHGTPAVRAGGDVPARPSPGADGR
jgi:hypothetical protein